MINYLIVFLVGGLICALSQLLFDYTKYTVAHILVLLVVIGTILTGLGLYDPLIEFAGAGVTVPVMNFGNILTSGVLMEVERDGFLGLFAGVLEKGSVGITASIIIGFLVSVIFRPKE